MVPTGTPPGEYVTALVIENVDPVRGSGSVSIDQINRSAIAVAIEVPGPLRAEVQIGAVNHHRAGRQSVVTFEIDNPGNVHLKPAGDFRLLNADGILLSEGHLTMDSVYAGTSTLLEAPLADLLPAGDYCAELRLSDENTGAEDMSECLAFSVPTAPAPDGDASGPGSQSLPVTLPSSGMLTRAAPFIGFGLIGMALLGIALLMVTRRHRRRAALNPEPRPAAGQRVEHNTDPTNSSDA